MKEDSTDITVVLDRSGSMQIVRDDTIGGFNSFLADQKSQPGEATFTLVQFDNEYEVVHAGKKIADVPELTASTFVPRGSTALLDAIGRAINETGKRLADLPEHDRPARVAFVVVTDGEENASKEFTRERVFEQITHQREKYNWQFIFLGANQDAIKAATDMGMAAASSMTYAHNKMGTNEAFKSTSRKMSSYRDKQSKSMDFDEEDRKKQRDAGA